MSMPVTFDDLMVAGLVLLAIRGLWRSFTDLPHELPTEQTEV
ncbi:hypothetical protein [Tranquillimonas alkanivorans]|uniref:Uncharacterized protein n=1 Tax=Tranquillimonas alkanivorans TaxID=441119 RepID=A0A1I5KFW7_9RHOB|nr:hypothetical protein [Tranquillimonas alkanivorans]SFO83944.1 hypothetical protein SAMN04488047_10185 [Tranquillimonas alkanivorans]